MECQQWDKVVSIYERSWESVLLFWKQSESQHLRSGSAACYLITLAHAFNSPGVLPGDLHGMASRSLDLFNLQRETGRSLVFTQSRVLNIYSDPAPVHKSHMVY